MNPSVSVKNRSLRDSSRMRTRTRTRNGSMDACLSFTTVSNFTDTDKYTDHGHGSQITDIWMASFMVSGRGSPKSLDFTKNTPQLNQFMPEMRLEPMNVCLTDRRINQLS